MADPTNSDASLGQALDTLLQDVSDKALGDPKASYTAQLIVTGPARCAKKLGEEGVELALAVAGGTADEIASEAADLLYHMAVALAVRGVSPEAVAEVLSARRGTSGLEEKASRT